jgi:GDP-L-fucose synthase
MNLYQALYNDRLIWLQAQKDLTPLYKGKYILITGASGFIGRQLTAFLTDLGAHIIAPTHNEYDLTNQLDTFDLFKQRSPFDMVFHLAAGWMGIGRTSVNPAKSFYDNLQMGVNMIDACHLFDDTKIVIAGSVCAYPANIPVPYREHNLWQGQPESTNGPYGIAKRALLTMLQSYYAQFRLPSAYLLVGNTYGPGDNFDLETSHVIPALIRKFVEAKRNKTKAVEVWGDGKVTRSFSYVTDIAAGFVLAGARIDTPEPLNVGSDGELFIEWLAKYIAETVGYTGTLLFNASKPTGQRRRSLCIDKARDQMGWVPSVPIAKGLAATLSWYMGVSIKESLDND